jgi:hypothetical protein
VKAAGRGKHIEAGCVDIYSSQEIEEAESAGEEDSRVAEPEKVEKRGATCSSQVPGGVGEPAPGQGLKEVAYEDVQRRVVVVMSASGTKQEFKLRKGPKGTAVYDRAGSACETEIPNLMLDPPILKRPAAAPKPAAGRKKAKKEQELNEELGGGAEAPQGPEPEGDEGEGEVEAEGEGEVEAEGEEEELAEAEDGEEPEALQSDEEPQGEAEASAAPEGPAPEPQAGAPAEGAAARRYVVMWYRPPRGALALRQAYGCKRQICQVVAASVGSTKEQLEALFARLIGELQAGTLEEAGAKAWVIRELAKLLDRRRAA